MQSPMIARPLFMLFVYHLAVSISNIYNPYGFFGNLYYYTNMDKKKFQTEISPLVNVVFGNTKGCQHSGKP